MILNETSIAPTYDSGIALAQSILKKLGFYNGTVDGIYGNSTIDAVKNFQEKYGLDEDGIIGAKTSKALEKLILGYTFYKIQPGDTLSTIATSHYSSVNLIKSANPTIDPNILIPGEALIVPFKYNIVINDAKYTYQFLKLNVLGLSKRYPFLKVSSIGNSVLEKNLYLITFGNGPIKIHINGSHHALEWINSIFLMQFIETISDALINNKTIEGYNIKEIFNTHTFYIVPMVNPDGIDLVNEGLSKSNPYYNDLLKWNNTNKPFNEVWQANIRGVDLNHNYNAAWEESKKAEEQLGITGPGPTRYSGPYPFSEPETQAIRDLTILENFDLALAYHSQGEIIFWNFQNLSTETDKKIGEILAKASGYTLDSATGISSYAGYKDWFIQDFRKPGYTVETGKGKNPLPLSELPKIYEANMKLILATTDLNQIK